MGKGLWRGLTFPNQSVDSGYSKELGDAGAPRARKELRVTTCSEANIDVAWDDPWAQRRGRGSAGRRPEGERLRWEREDAEQKAGEGFPAPRLVPFLIRRCWSGQQKAPCAACSLRCMLVRIPSKHVLTGRWRAADGLYVYGWIVGITTAMQQEPNNIKYVARRDRKRLPDAQNHWRWTVGPSYN